MHSWIGFAIAAGSAAVILAALLPKQAARVTAAGAAVASLSFAAAWGVAPAHSPIVVDQVWLPVLNTHFHLELDGLAAPYCVFVTAVAAAVLLFTDDYLRHHLAEQQRPPQQMRRFCLLLFAFMTAMVVLLMARDLIVLFVALEVTSVTSFLLIEFDRQVLQARRNASWALLLTGASSLAFLIGALLVGGEAGTTDLRGIEKWLASDPESLPWVAGLLAAGLLAKSAQFPLHFWLPRAMVAPTPVSAYLHSAALVAAGAYVLMRLRFVLAAAPVVLDALVAVGAITIALGGLRALVEDEMKRVLAYSTMAQYGYALILIAWGGDKGRLGAAVFIFAHGLAKCALFLTAGAITTVTEQKKLSALGGLHRKMPVLAAASGVAALALAGMPWTVGYFKDEYLFAAASKRGLGAAIVVSGAAALTFAYTGRFWMEIFGGRRLVPEIAHRPQARLVLPIALLSAAALLFGIYPAWLEQAFGPAAEMIGTAHSSSLAGGRVDKTIQYHWGLKPELFMLLAAVIVGSLLVVLRGSVHRLLQPVARNASRFGPEAVAQRGAQELVRASQLLRKLEGRDLRDRIGAVLLPSALLVAAAFFSSGALLPSVGPMEGEHASVVAALVLTGGAAVLVSRTSHHLSLVLMASFLGFSLALTFAVIGALDVALVVVMTETLLTLLFAAFLWQVAPDVLDRARRVAKSGERSRWVGLAGGAMAFLLSWTALDARTQPIVADLHITLAKRAHAKDVVTAILTDFRGLDTAGEVTVLAVAILGAAAISWEGSS